MCGRFSLSTPVKSLTDFFQVEILGSVEPHYNIAPSQKISGIFWNPEGEERKYTQYHWGLIPSWAKDPKIGTRMINARAETVAEKPAFRAAFKKRRCLVLADGFYEWQKLEKRKQPYYFYLKEKNPFAFAGLWESWNDKKGKIIESCTLITTDANSVLKPIHHRMPVILHPKDYDKWLDPERNNPKDLLPFLKPCSPEEMKGHAVSTRVNNPKNDQPSCIEPLKKST